MYRRPLRRQAGVKVRYPSAISVLGSSARIRYFSAAYSSSREILCWISSE